MPLSHPCGCLVDASEPPCSCASDAHEAELDAVADAARDAGRAAARAAQDARSSFDVVHWTPSEACVAIRSAYARALAAAVLAALCDCADLDDAAEAAVEGLALGWADAFAA